MIAESEPKKIQGEKQPLELVPEPPNDEVSIEENTSDYRDLYFTEDKEATDIEDENSTRIDKNLNEIVADDGRLVRTENNPNYSSSSASAPSTEKNFDELFVYKRTLENNPYESCSAKRTYDAVLDAISELVVDTSSSSDLFTLENIHRENRSDQFISNNGHHLLTKISPQEFRDRGISPCKIRRHQSLSSSDDEEEFWPPFFYPVVHSCKGEKDNKKRVRFYVTKMEGDMRNFRVTLSIKNEANGQTVFYKGDKNRFRKEKTIKLMVETTYRIDISFKPTQTLARALIGGNEVKVTERVHDSTASAYSLHLPTSSLQPSAKGHREEIIFLIQLANGMLLQTELQVKFYKLSDTQHGEWGSTFHCVEYDCETSRESGSIAVLKETYR